MLSVNMKNERTEQLRSGSGPAKECPIYIFGKNYYQQ